MGSRFFPDPRQNPQTVLPEHLMHLLHHIGHSPFGTVTRSTKLTLDVPLQNWQSTNPVPWQCSQQSCVVSMATFCSTSPRCVSIIRCFLVFEESNEHSSCVMWSNGVHAWEPEVLFPLSWEECTTTCFVLLCCFMGHTHVPTLWLTRDMSIYLYFVKKTVWNARIQQICFLQT